MFFRKNKTFTHNNCFEGRAGFADLPIVFVPQNMHHTALTSMRGSSGFEFALS